MYTGGYPSGQRGPAQNRMISSSRVRLPLHQFLEIPPF